MNLVRFFTFQLLNMFELDLTRMLGKIKGLVALPNSPISESSNSSLSVSKSSTLPLWMRVDKRFWYNERILAPLIEKSLHSWILPVMQGFVQIEQCSMEDQLFDFILISRRSKERAGMRYQRRGVNDQGEVANFVETEQILFLDVRDIQL